MKKARLATTVVFAATLLLSPAIANAQPAKAAPLPTCNTVGQAKDIDVPAHAATRSDNCTLKFGDNNAAVVTLKQSLTLCYKAKGLDLRSQKFDAKTKTALVAAQKQIGAKADGVYGPETKTKMKWKNMFVSRCDAYTLG